MGGRYRPWLLIAAPLTSLVLIFSFWAHPEWSSTAKIMYMAITYCILVLGYTCVNIPYGTLCGAMTQNIEERAQINTFRSVSEWLQLVLLILLRFLLLNHLEKGMIKRDIFWLLLCMDAFFQLVIFFAFICIWNNNIYFRPIISAACFKISFSIFSLWFSLRSRIGSFSSSLRLSSIWNEPVLFNFLIHEDKAEGVSSYSRTSSVLGR